MIQPDERPAIRAIIAALGPEWTTEPADKCEPNSDYNKANQIVTNGVIKFWFKAKHDYNDRPEPYHITSHYPRPKDDTFVAHGQEISINISRTKKPAQIARDIQRRFLDEYTPRYMAIVERIKIHERDQNRLIATEEMIAAALEQKLHENPYGRGNPRTITLSPYRNTGRIPYGEAKFNSYLEATIEIKNAPPELVIQIGKVLQQAAKWQQAQQVKP